MLIRLEEVEEELAVRSRASAKPERSKESERSERVARGAREH